MNLGENTRLSRSLRAVPGLPGGLIVVFGLISSTTNSPPRALLLSLAFAATIAQQGRIVEEEDNIELLNDFTPEELVAIHESLRTLRQIFGEDAT